MPWFITSICSDNVLNEIRIQNQNLRQTRPQRTFGFFNTYTEAIAAIEENRCNMQECLYDYLVLEYIDPGIHPLSHIVEWFKWNDLIICGWMSLGKEVPKEFVGIINFALG